MYYYHDQNPTEHYAYENRRIHSNTRENCQNSLSVHGKGEIIVKPDQAKLTVGVVTENLNVQEAQFENSTITTRVISALRALGINEGDIKTSVYSIQPQYDYTDGKSVLRAYQVDHQLEIIMKDLSKIGIVYDQAIKNGANRAGNIVFFVSNSEAYYRDALKRAVWDASKKAEAIVATIGAKLNKLPIKMVEEAIPQDRIYPVFSYKLAAASAQESPPIQKGEFIIEAKVKVEFAYQAKM